MPHMVSIAACIRSLGLDKTTLYCLDRPKDTIQAAIEAANLPLLVKQVNCYEEEVI